MTARITELPEASALSGSEMVELVQGGASVRSRVDAVWGGGSARIGRAAEPLGGNSHSLQEASWNRAIATRDVRLTSVRAAISAVSSDVRLRVLEVTGAFGNPTVVAVVHESDWESISTPVLHEFGGLSVALEADKLYCFMVESQSGSSLSLYAPTDDEVLRGDGILRAPSPVGGSASRDVGVSGTLSSFSTVSPTFWLDYR